MGEPRGLEDGVGSDCDFAGLYFKPGCQVRILSGSGEQAGMMYEYLTSFLRNGFEEFLAGPIRKSKCRFANGSAVEVLKCYRYPEGGRAGELPLKDGLYDRPIDALRYFFVNYKCAGKTTSRRY